MQRTSVSCFYITNGLKSKSFYDIPERIYNIKEQNKAFLISHAITALIQTVYEWGSKKKEMNKGENSKEFEK